MTDTATSPAEWDEKEKDLPPVEPGTKYLDLLTATITGTSFLDVVDRLANLAAENSVPEGQWAAVYFSPIYGHKEIRGYTVQVNYRQARFDGDPDLY